MNTYLLFLVLGLATGGVYAGLSLGIVVGYRGSGVINFGQGAVMTYVAYTYAELRNSGRLLVPVPSFVSLTPNGTPLGLWPALVIALAMGCVLGLAMHYLVFDRLRDSPALGKLVASLGILAVLQALIAIRYADNQRVVAPILPTNSIPMFGGSVTADVFWIAGIAVAITIGLYCVYRWTRFGLRTRAAAENEEGAIVLGYSPSRTAAANWVIATLVSSVLGILASPITQLTPTNFTLFIIPALGAALLARLDSLLITLVASFILGMIDSVLVLAVTRFSWLPQSGTRDLVPFLVVAIAVFLRGSKLPSRGARMNIRLPAVHTRARSPLLAAGATLLALAGVIFLSGSWRGALITSLIGIIIALSFVTLTGFLGQISLSQLAVAGLAGFFLMRLTSSWDLPFPVGPLMAIAGATIVGVIVALPALRVRGVNLAIITLAAAAAVENLVFNNNSLNPPNGSLVAKPPAIFGFRFDPFSRLSFGGSGIPGAKFGIFVLIIVLFCCWAVSNLQRSETGRRLLAVRGDETAAAALGLSVVRTKLLGMTISAALASVGGVLLVYQNAGNVSAAQFAALMSVTALGTAYLGGITSVSGAVLAGMLTAGGMFFYILTSLFGVQDWTQLILGLGLIITVILNPAGMADEFGKMKRQVTALIANRMSANKTAPRLRGAAGPVPAPAPVAVGGGDGQPSADRGGPAVPGLEQAMADEGRDG